MKLPDFFTHMDRQAVRAILIVILMFAVVISILAFGKASMNLDDGVHLRWFEAFSQSPWSVVIVILTFVGAAFLGVPQWALIAGTVFAFGPINGSLFSWGATMISASLNFWLGRWIGAERVHRFGGDLVNRIVAVVRKNGFVTSLAVRLVPTGPFVLVNMAAGISNMKFMAFLSGTGIGIVPKILIVAFLGQSVLAGAQGKLYMLVFLIIALAFLGLMLLARRRLAPSVQMPEETDNN